MKLFYTFAFVCICLGSFAIDSSSNKFQQKKKALRPMQESELEKITKKFKNFEQVPTMIKNYGWSDSLNAWEGESREEITYANDKIVSIYTFDIDRTDTISRLTLTYNPDNYLQFYFFEYYLGNGEYVPQTRIYYEYENNYAKMTVTNELFNYITNVWIPNTRFSEEKINNGETSRITNFFYLPGGWSEVSGYSYTIRKLNNNSSKVSEYIDSILNTNLSRYEFFYRESRVYDANENAIAIVYSENINGTIETTEIDSISYINNTPSKLTIYLVENNIARRIYKYDNMNWLNYNSNLDLNENTLTDYTGFLSSSNLWFPNDRLSTSFTDNFGSSIALVENYVNNTWTPVERSTKNFNSRAYLLLSQDEKYDATDSKWEINTAYSRNVVYDISNNIIELSQARYNTILEIWENTEKEEFFDFITISTGIKNYKNTFEMLLYPNPSTNGSVNINVNLEAASALTIKVVDLKGSIVYTDKKELGKGLNTVELGGLQQGLYVVELKTEFGVVRTKLAVR
jgi:hypothetical protein